MAWINRLRGLLGGKHVKCNVSIVGLKNSGKSTILIQLKPPQEKIEHVTPSINLGLSAEYFQSMALTFVAFDLGELDGFGNPWEDFYRDTDAVIFVVDSSDRYNLPLVREQLDKLLGNPLIRDKTVPMVFLANKMDQPGSMPGVQLAADLHLNMLQQDKPWIACSTDALTGEGLHEAFDWLAHKLRAKFREESKESLFGF